MTPHGPHPTGGTLRLEGICVTRGETEVLKDLSLAVAPGSFTTVLGPSGAGKSTIFELLLGSLAPDAGQITLDGAPLKPDLFAYMPQRDALMPWRRILSNVTLGLEVQGMSRAAARARVLPLLPRFGLDGFERHWPQQLSGGMRQRAALARTIVQDRPVMLLDEPFGALDAMTRRDMQRWLEAQRDGAPQTTILITHDLREAVALSDRIHLLSPRPARVVQTFDVPLPRPRLTAAPTEAALKLENDILDTLMQGDTT